MEARLHPLSVPGEQECEEFSLSVEPETPIFSYDQPGQMGMVHHFLVRNDPHDTLAIHARSVVQTLRPNPFQDLNLLADDWDMRVSPELTQEFAEYLAPTPLIPLTGVWQGPPLEPSVLKYAQAVSDAIYTQFEYVPGATDISTPLAEFVAQKRGVCQDYAHLMLAAGRAQGIPARYVSGYVASGDPTTHGTGATHAWAEFYIPHARVWKGFDPTNNIMVGDKHIKIAVGRDYNDVPPTKGLLRSAPGLPLPAETDLDVTVSVDVM